MKVHMVHMNKLSCTWHWRFFMLDLLGFGNHPKSQVEMIISKPLTQVKFQIISKAWLFPRFLGLRDVFSFFLIPRGLVLGNLDGNDQLHQLKDVVKGSIHSGCWPCCSLRRKWPTKQPPLMYSPLIAFSKAKPFLSKLPNSFGQRGYFRRI